MATEKDFPGFGFGQDLGILAGGLAVFLAIASTRVLVGSLYGQAEVVRFLEAIQDPALFFGSALATSSTTSLALMLTLLGFTHRLEADFDAAFFQRIYRIGFYSVVTLCGSVILIVTLIFPLGEFDALPQSWFPKLYTGIVLTVAALAGLIFVSVLLLFRTIRSVIEVVTPAAEKES